MGNSSWLKGTQKQKRPNLLTPKGTDWLFLENVSLKSVLVGNPWILVQGGEMPAGGNACPVGQMLPFLKPSFYFILLICIWLHRVLVGALGIFCHSALDFPVVARRLSCSAACRILVPQSGTEPAAPALKGSFLTTGPPGKSLEYPFVSAVSWLEICEGHSPHHGNCVNHQ